MDFAIMAEDFLGLVLLAGDGVVGRKDGERIDQQFILVVYRLLHLQFGTVLLTEETGTFCQCLLVDFGSRGTDAGRIELHAERSFTERQVARLHLMQVAEMEPGVFPGFQLTHEEARKTV